MRQVEVFVPGSPRPQGSGKLITSRSTGQSFTKYHPTTVDWRNVLVSTFIGLGTEMFEAEVAVHVSLSFYFDRPRSHSRKRREGDGGWKVNGPDIDKLSRLVLDALTISKVIADDRQVGELWAKKRYVAREGEPEGVLVKVWPSQG